MPLTGYAWEKFSFILQTPREGWRALPRTVQQDHNYHNSAGLTKAMARLHQLLFIIDVIDLFEWPLYNLLAEHTRAHRQWPRTQTSFPGSASLLGYLLLCTSHFNFYSWGLETSVIQQQLSPEQPPAMLQTGRYPRKMLIKRAHSEKSLKNLWRQECW